MFFALSIYWIDFLIENTILCVLYDESFANLHKYVFTSTVSAFEVFANNINLTFLYKIDIDVF